jgi:hypothetical protein
MHILVEQYSDESVSYDIDPIHNKIRRIESSYEYGSSKEVTFKCARKLFPYAEAYDSLVTISLDFPRKQQTNCYDILTAIEKKVYDLIMEEHYDV